MLSEYKRDNQTRELARLSAEVEQKQDESRQLDSLTSSRREEMKHFDAIGFTKDEVGLIILKLSSLLLVACLKKL